MGAELDPDAPARADSGIYGLDDAPNDAATVLVPVPWDATTSYRAGTSKGPAAILEASRQVDLYDLSTGRPYEGGIAMLPISPQVAAWNDEARRAAEPIIEAGGAIGDDRDLSAKLARVNALSAQVNDWVEAEVERYRAMGKLVGVVGGDHSVPFGAIRAFARAHPGLSVLHVDAHCDLRDAYEGFTFSHASIMHNVLARIPDVSRLVQVGIRDFGEKELETIRESNGRVVTFFAEELATGRFHGETWAAQSERIVASLSRDVYLSIDIDGLDPAFCPNTGTPVPGGLSFQELVYLVGAIAKSRRIVGFDLNEVAPGEDEWDANVGARLLYKMIGWAKRSRLEVPRG